MRRFTGSSNAFSEKTENHQAAIALSFMWYNLGRKRMTLKTTPAAAAGIETKIWTVMDIVEMAERIRSDSN